MLISCLRRSVEDSRVWPENGQNTFLVHLVKMWQKTAVILPISAKHFVKNITELGTSA